ncbi:translation initiation factor IF-2-like [Schistocerca gregaria]|uniref:translation initiation factor IF-2-like n=1 Tax=Schistocerca gregaria TaxID=7010 RepID=UPI00211E37CF|nr:translation initiation factor IF-2-like [Schistocerca gregaria]
MRRPMPASTPQLYTKESSERGRVAARVASSEIVRARPAEPGAAGPAPAASVAARAGCQPEADRPPSASQQRAHRPAAPGPAQRSRHGSAQAHSPTGSQDPPLPRPTAPRPASAGRSRARPGPQQDPPPASRAKRTAVRTSPAVARQLTSTHSAARARTTYELGY